MTKIFNISTTVRIGGNEPPVLIAGPCVIEGNNPVQRADMALWHAERIARIAGDVGMPFVFKISYDKANRTSRRSYRGPGISEGLRVLEQVRREVDVPVLTDAHSVEEIVAVCEVVDVVQIPAFLCRQTDLLEAAAKTDTTVNVKKGQFIAPDGVKHIIDKVVGAGGERVMITERGVSFGYGRLIVDFTGIVRMHRFGWPVIFDATHSVQTPGGQDDRSGGDRSNAPYLAWAAAAVGVEGLFVETHTDPDKALSDGPNMIPLDQLSEMLKRFLSIDAIGRERS